MSWYAALVDDDEVRDEYLGSIVDEYHRTEQILSEIYGGPLVERRPNIARTLELRDPGLRPLHRRQIELVRRWRSSVPGPAQEALLTDLLVTVNAIAGGLGSTG